MLYKQSSMLLLFVTALFIAAALVTGARAQTHPFLLVKEVDYAALRSRASRWPWNAMKTAALSDAKNLELNTSDDTRFQCERVRDMVSSAALAYILDTANKAAYLAELKTVFGLLDDLYALRATDWNFMVNAGSAVFNSVLALDIVYNDLTSTERNGIESDINALVQYIAGSNWPLNQYGVRGIWALYKGDAATFSSMKNSYRSTLLGYLTEDGVFGQGPVYAWVRLGGNRDAKAYFMDVLEFTGQGSFYDEPVLGRFNEWLFSGAVTPNAECYTFGDSHTAYYGSGAMAAAGRAGRFSELAGKLAAWNNGGADFPGRLLPYLLMDDPFPTATGVVSRIYSDGGAWFWEPDATDRSLAGAMWNPKTEGGHSHYDVNALHLCAYGEHVLRNAGYAGWNTGALGYDWEYIHNNAAGNNVVLVNNANHKAKHGNGISEGFTCDALDYACGHSGGALTGGTHERSFVYVRPMDGRNGYWAVFDEVAASAGAGVNVLWHPNADNATVVADGREYRAKIGPYGDSGHDVYVTAFFGTAPDTVLVRNSVLAEIGTGSFDGKYLRADFTAGGDGRKRIISVLFPHDATHAKAAMARVAGNGYSGASVALGGGITDVALESAGSAAVAHNGVGFTGKAALYRLNGTDVASYFVRKGTEFDNGASPRSGFDADAAVSVFVRGTSGRIVSPGTDVTFYDDGITGVEVDGVSAAVKASGTGKVTVNIGAGTHELSFTTGTPAPDTVAPTIRSVAAGGSTSVTVVFSEAVDAGDAATAANYAVSGGIIVESAVLGADLQTVTLTTSALTVGTEYMLTVNGIRDRAVAPNTMAPSVHTVEYAVCTASTETWQSMAFEAQNGRFIARFSVTPQNMVCNGLIALSQGSVSTWSDCAVIVRFSNQGKIDVRNGDAYEADTDMAYAADSTYRFRLEVDVAAHTYDVSVNAGGTETVLASGYAFRTDQAAVPVLDTWSLNDDTGMVRVCNIDVTVSGGINRQRMLEKGDVLRPGCGSLFRLDGRQVNGSGTSGHGVYLRRSGNEFFRVLVLE